VIGIYLVQKLLSLGYTNIEIFTRSGANETLPFASDGRVTFTKGDIVELHPLSDSVANADYIIHAAAIVSFNPKKFDAMKSVNVEGTANLMNLAIDNDIKKVVHVSSIAAIGRDEKGEQITEETKWSNSKYNSYYGITKYLAEQEAWRAHHEGLPIAIINPALVFGGELWDQSSLQIFNKVYKGLPYFPVGGTAIVDVKDVTDMIIHLLESEIAGERYIAASENILYRDLFTKMANAMNVKPPKKPAPKWMLSVMWRIEKFRNLLFGTEPLVTRESVKSTAHPSKYNNQKSKELGWGTYRSVDDTITEYSKEFVDSL